MKGRVYLLFLIIALIGLSTILIPTYGIVLFSKHSTTMKLIGSVLISLGVILIFLWKYAVEYFGSRWRCF